MHTRTILILVLGSTLTLLHCGQVQGRSVPSNLSSEQATPVEDDPGTTNEPLSSVAPVRQRQPFRLSGPSLDFQEGSVQPAPAPPPLQTVTKQRSLNMQRSNEGVDFDDYNEFGARVHSESELSPQQKKPIYIKKINMNLMSKVNSENALPETSTDTELLHLEDTTLTPLEIAEEIVEITTEQTEVTATQKEKSDLVEFDPDGIDME